MFLSFFANECSDACGWIAALVAVVAFGSFGVPLKSVQTTVHPLVVQSYKTTMCFLTCWLVLFAGVPFKFSPWGIASGLFWVPGSSCGIYAIRSAGLAIAVGTWSAITVITSVVFGMVIFHEKMRNVYYGLLSFVLLIIGLIGMAKYSQASPSSSPAPVPVSQIPPPPPPPNQRNSPQRTSSGRARSPSPYHPYKKSLSVDDSATKSLLSPMEMESLLDTAEDRIMYDDDDKIKAGSVVVLLFGRSITITQRQLGIIGAVINGGWGGLNLIPLHFAAASDESLRGAGYLISYAVGSMIVNVMMWVIWFLYEYVRGGFSFPAATEAMPSFQVETWLVPSCLAGILYSIGNFCSILAVAYLGQSTGFSVCMMQLFVSGLWGVFFLDEIRGEAIFPWFTSAFVAVAGILGLSYQHEGGAGGHRLLEFLTSS